MSVQLAVDQNKTFYFTESNQAFNFFSRKFVFKGSAHYRRLNFVSD